MKIKVSKPKVLAAIDATTNVKSTTYKGLLNSKLSFVGNLIVPVKSSNSNILVMAYVNVPAVENTEFHSVVESLTNLGKRKYPATLAGLQQAKDYIEGLTELLGVNNPKWLHG